MPISDAGDKSYPRHSENQNTLELSVIMPAYNEEGSIVSAVEDIQKNVLDYVPASELVVVNDGSRDETGTLLDNLSHHDPRILAHHQINGGHGAALITGLSLARGKYILLVDSDLQIPLETFENFWGAIKQGYDGAFGVRRVRHDPVIRLWLTKLVRVSFRVLFGINIFDANVPYKLLRHSIWTEASQYIPADTLAPSLFLAIYTKRKGYRIAEIDVTHRERDTGEVSIRRLNLLKFCAKAFRQMLAFRQAIHHVR